MNAMVIAKECGKREQVLFLRPGCDFDREVLDFLATKFVSAGFGRDPKTMEVIHLELPLTWLEEATDATEHTGD